MLELTKEQFKELSAALRQQERSLIIAGKGEDYPDFNNDINKALIYALNNNLVQFSFKG